MSLGTGKIGRMGCLMSEWGVVGYCGFDMWGMDVWGVLGCR